jgi:hypothetical protein
MGKIKLPKSLTRLLFPKKKKSKHHVPLTVIDEGSDLKPEVLKPVKGEDGLEINGGNDNKEGAVSNVRDKAAGGKDAAARQQAYEDSVGLHLSALDSPKSAGDAPTAGSKGVRMSFVPMGSNMEEVCKISSVQFSFDEDDASFVSDAEDDKPKDGIKEVVPDLSDGESSPEESTPEEAVVESKLDAVESESNANEVSSLVESNSGQPTNDHPDAKKGLIANQKSSTNTDINSKPTEINIKTTNLSDTNEEDIPDLPEIDTSTTLNTTQSTQNEDPIPDLPVVSPLSSPTRCTNPAAERARKKAIARQKRILSKCEERLNALSGTAEATLELSKSVDRRSDGSIANRARSKPKDVKEKKSFSTVVFYERPNQATEEIDLFQKQLSVSPLASPTATSIDQDGFPINNSPSPTSLSLGPIPFFILLLDPKSRIFELIEINDASPSSSIGDILKSIGEKCTDERLSEMYYVGLCRPSDRVEFLDLGAAAFPNTASSQQILENDVLVAILEDSTGFQMTKISKPILKNAKFRDMIRRRRKGKKKASTHVEIIDAVETKEAPVDSLEAKKEKYDSLCKKLENLSKKLHQVDEEIMAGEVAIQTSSEQPSVLAPKLAVDTSASDTAEATGTEVAYRMSPKMVASELAQHIEDIFADHDVEILAVDADDDESDDESFVSARSHKSTRSARSIKRMEVAKQRRQLRANTNLFESNDDNALALQIEAMAVEAEEAFESRHGKKPIKQPEPAEDIYEIPDVEEYDMIEELNDDGVAAIPEEMNSSDILDTMKSLTRGSTVVDVSNCSAEQKEALSRNFLNTSTSMGK